MADYVYLYNVTEGLLSLPGGVPPPGVKPNYANPERRNVDVLVGGTITTVFMLVCAGLRVWSKVVSRSWWWDDMTCLLAVLGNLTCFATGVYMATHGPWGIHGWDLKLSDSFNGPAQIALLTFGVGQMFAIVFIKATFFLVFWRIFGTLRYMRIILLTVGSFFVFACFASNLFGIAISIPVGGQTFVTHAGTLAEWWVPLVIVEQAAVSATADLFILILPIPAVFGLQMPRKRQFAVAAVFLVGGIGCAAAIVNLCIRAKLYATGITKSDSTYGTEPILAASLIECNLGIACACAPSVSYLMRNSRRLRSWAARATPVGSRLQSLTSGRRKGASSSAGESFSGARSSTLVISRAAPQNKLDAKDITVTSHFDLSEEKSPPKESV